MPPEPAPDLRFARLERRAERERRAREQAERIAEESIRRGWERQRDIELLGRVAVAANEATGPAGAVTACLPLIARHVGWPGAFAWLMNDNGTALEPAAEWRAKGSEGFPRTSRRWAELPGAAGEGLPGRAVAAGAPTWDTGLFPAGDDDGDGIGCALAVPLRAGSTVVGVAAFVHQVPTELPDDVVHFIEQLCGQIGLAADRARTLAELQRIRRELDARVARRTEQVQSARRDAEAANRAKESLLVALTHEVRTPLNGILGMLELVLLEDPPPPLDGYVRAAESSARTLLSLFNDLVELVEQNLAPGLIEERLRRGFSDPSAIRPGDGGPSS